MATYYIDPNWTGTTFGTLTQPWTNFSSVGALSAGDKVLFKRNTTHVGSVTIAYSGTKDNRIKFSTYYNSDGSDNTNQVRPIIVCGTTSQNAILFNNQSGLVIENLQVTAPVTSDLGNGIGGYAQAAGAGYHITIRNCHAFNCKNVGIALPLQYRTGLAVDPTCNNLMENCTSTDTGSLGIGCGGGKQTGVIVRNCKVTRACLTADFGGLYAGNIKATLAPGGATFSLVSGTIYNRTFTKAQINSGSTGVLEYISAVSIASDAFSALGSMLRLNTATPTTPGVGEYGFTGADPITLYVNLGVANTSYPAMYVYPDIGNVLIEGCEVSYTKWRTVECFALYIDDSLPATVRGCWVHHNENRGIMVHRGTGCKIYSNVVENNATYGIAVTGGMNTLIYNNIIRNNLSNGIQLGTVSTGCEVRNNIIEGNVIGISGMTDTVASNNCFYNNSSSNITGFTSAGGDITTVPGIVSNRIVDTSSNLYNAGTHVGYRMDAVGNQFNNLPSIGAYEYVKPRQTATARQTRV